MVRLAVLAITALLLASCGDARLEAENAVLRQRLEQQHAARAAEIAEWERRAAVTQACNWLIPACPASMTAPGERALKAGYSGGGWLFWGLAAAKLLTLCAGLSGLFMGLWWGYTKLVAPAQADAEAAQKLVATAEARAARAKSEAAILEARVSQLKAEVERLQEEAKTAATAAQRARAEADAAAALRDAITGL